MGTQLNHATAPFWPTQMSFLVKPGCELEGITNDQGSFLIESSSITRESPVVTRVFETQLSLSKHGY